MLGGFGLSAVDGEPVFAAYLQGSVDVPALVQIREPLGNVVVALLVPVYTGRCQRAVQEVGGELRPGCWAGGTEAAVVGLGACDDVFDVRFLDGREPSAGVGAVNAALGVDEALFD